MTSWTCADDPIGNRTALRAWNDPGAANQKYVGNALNQYAQVRLRSTPEQFQSYGYDADGNLANVWLAADMNCDGATNFGDINPFVQAVSNPSAWQATYPGCNILNGDINGDGTVGFGDINPLASGCCTPERAREGRGSSTARCCIMARHSLAAESGEVSWELSVE